jgi:hypothetical protein
MQAPQPHQFLKIPQPEHGGNAVGFVLVNQSLLLRHARNPCLTSFDTSVALNPQSPPIVRHCREILLTVRACASFCSRGAQRMFAMFEMVTAVMGLVGAGIFIAHAFEGVLSRT